jgi:hypothetical protein
VNRSSSAFLAARSARSARSASSWARRSPAIRLSARARSPSSSGRVEGERVVEVPRRDLPGGPAHLGERPGEAPGEEDGREEAQAEGDREGGDTQREERGAAARPHGSRPRLEAAQGGLPGRLREGDDAPAGRDPSRGDHEADLGLPPFRTIRSGPGGFPRQVPVEAVAVPLVLGRAVGEDESLLVDDEERLDRQPDPDLLDLLVEPLDVELVEGVEEVRAQVPRRPPQGRLLVGGAGCVPTASWISSCTSRDSRKAMTLAAARAVATRARVSAASQAA